ncbi:DUF7739 domain-containing protein [Streptomyces sp. 4N509B]|uniref:DUF7739 domain-containing protein n=1 Tax=Streptomyces sp. 4N509B TaxID=3457413 RepID=UPI003FD62DF1
MGWTIQHIPGRTECRSYSAVHDALRAAQAKLSPVKAAAFSPLLDRHGDAWVELTPQQTEAIRDALKAAISRVWLRNRDSLFLLRDLAEAADTAARSGQPWRWN